ncbi:pyridoxal phosphate-dependent decarboxylase family protein [Ktedonospora formicarum]|uniref:Aromatic-L-amino-acid decarboxylase n=1 Tax=Ktedonospora formicarum TaxID=2778364 RepID=A0A8J3HWM1_9CHLR|nr:pyridoxal-dependent decarboxylase [Ktedonospora formicarum]GHO44586.1 aromatic-L-amino-acid decarboxylase [Ktedonospora formicarum]
MQIQAGSGPLPREGDMDAEALRRYGHLFVDWIADYMRDIQSYPVLAQVKPGDIRQALPSIPPAHGEEMEHILADVERVIMPGITHWNSGNFMAYFGVTSSGPCILADMLTGAFNVSRMLWKTSPAATELEQVTLDWLRQMLGLPGPLFGMIHHNSAIANALAAAREMVPGLHVRQKGLAGRKEMPRLRFYASEEAHSSVEKAAILLGLGQESLRKIETDADYCMNVEALDQAIREDLRSGWWPFAVIATVGTTSTTSVDPVEQIADMCERYGLWLHVDAAYAGAAAIMPEMRWILRGCERADSLAINPHKWLFTSFSCSVFYTRRPQALRSAFSLTPDYLQNNEGHSGQALNLMDYDASLPHGFPALKLWMTLRYFGQDGLVNNIAAHCRLARQFSRWVEFSPTFELLVPTRFSVVCFRTHPAGMHNEEQLDRLNERVLNRVNAGGRTFLSSSRLKGRYTLRLAIGNLRTTEAEICVAWEELQKALRLEMGSIPSSWSGLRQGRLHLLSFSGEPTTALSGSGSIGSC